MSINISYACNEAYMEQTTVSLLSLYMNCSTPNKIIIYFIDMGVEEQSKEDLIALVEKYQSKIVFVPFEDIAYDLKVSEKRGRHIKSVYAKLFFGRIAGIDKIIYLDSDIVVVDDITKLWRIDLNNYVCAGVETIHSIEDNASIGYSKDDRAINDGMVVMNLKKWRDGNYLEKCLEYIKKYKGEPPVLSEGTINAVCKGEIKILHPRYNLMSAIIDLKSKKIMELTERRYYSQRVVDEAIANPCLIHFLCGYYNRPWCKECNHPMKNIYLKYRNMTKWAKKPLLDNKLPKKIKLIGIAIRYLPTKVFKSIRKIFLLIN